jgi:hypothetical protein
VSVSDCRVCTGLRGWGMAVNEPCFIIIIIIIINLMYLYVILDYLNYLAVKVLTIYSAFSLRDGLNINVGLTPSPSLSECVTVYDFF